MLFGLSAKIYRLAWEPVSFEKLVKKLPEATEEMIRNTLEELIHKKWMLFISGKYLALAAMNRNLPEVDRISQKGKA